MKKFLLAISGVLLALGAFVAPANAQQASSAFIVSACGTLPAGLTYAAGQYGILTMDTTGKLCDSATGGGGGGGAVFGPTAAGSAAANPPVIVGGTADGTATGNVVNWKVLAGIGYINCANCSGSGVSTVDEAGFTAGTSLFAGTGGFFQTTATSNPLTNGQQGMFQVTANRALFSNLRNAAGAEIGVAAAPVQVSLANTAANAAAVLVNQPTGMNLHTVLDTTSTTAVTQATGTNLHAVIDTGSTTAVTGNVTVVQPTGTNLHAVLDTTSTTAVTQATGTNLHAVIDTGSTTAVTQATGTNLHTVVDSGTITTVSSLSQQTGWAGGTLGAMAAYGTSPGAVLVPGVNAFITNATPGIANNADAIAAVAASATSPVPVNGYNYVFNGTTWDRLRSGTQTGSVAIASADPCLGANKTNFTISTTSGTVQLVAPSGSTQVYICSLFTVGGTASIQNVVGGTGATCTTGTPVAIAGSTTAANGMSFAANGGFTFGNGGGTILRTTTAGHGVCLIQSATAQISGGGTFVQQ